MFVFESIEDVLKGKTQDEVQSNFREKYGIEFTEMPETVKRMKERGIDAKIGFFNTPGESNNKPIKIPAIEVVRIEIKTSLNGYQWVVLGTVLDMKAAEEVVSVLKKHLNIGDRRLINTDSSDYEYKIEKERFIYYYSNTDALKILAKMQKNES